jgi:hypothetical protein
MICLITGRLLLCQLRNAIKLTLGIIVEYHCYQLYRKSYSISFSCDNECGFQRNKSITDQIFCILDTGKKLECNQLFRIKKILLFS